MATPASTVVSTPATSPAVTDAAVPARNRLLTLLVTLAAALVMLVVPQTSASAHAYAPHTAATAAKWANNMLYVLNNERRAHGLAPLRMNTRLILSAHRHNMTMAWRDAMSHQLPGEAFFADRISRTGYDWRAAGENIGWNSRQTNWGLQRLQKEMYAEKAPDNGHRLNILSRSFRQVGIDVYFDQTHNKMWFTQDFGQPAA